MIKKIELCFFGKIPLLGMLAQINIDEFNFHVEEPIYHYIGKHKDLMLEYPIQRCIQEAHGRYITALQKAIQKIAPEKAFEIYQEIKDWEKQ